MFGLVGMAFTASTKMLIDRNYFYYRGRHPAEKIYKPSITTFRIPMRDTYMIRVDFDGFLTDATITFACIINDTFAIYTFDIGQFLFGPNGKECQRFAEEIILACEANDIDLTIVGNGKEFRRETCKENYERLTSQIINEYGHGDDDDDNGNESQGPEDDTLMMEEKPQVESNELKLLFGNVKVQYVSVFLFGAFLYYAAYLSLCKFGLIPWQSL